MNPILEVKHLSVSFPKADSQQRQNVVDDVSWDLYSGEILGIVGESGSGKSMSALSILGLLPYPKAQHSTQSQIIYNHQNLINNKELPNIRGNKISLIFQEPMSSLNPLHTIGHQISEMISTHQKLEKKQLKATVIKLLRQTGIKNPKQRYKAYPHELSGGQRQRVMIAMAIANNPEILIADEPTTALDVTIQAQIIELLIKLQKQLKMSIIFISHDLHLIRKIASRVIVMKDGKIIEQGPTENIFNHPQKDYTKTLINAYNGLNNINNTSNGYAFELQDLTVNYPIQKNFFGKTIKSINALNHLNLKIKKQQTLGIVGESGSGKTTFGQTLVHLIPYQGKIIYEGREVNFNSKTENLNFRRKVQIVFQDPYNSLNPRMTTEQIINEGLMIHYPQLSKQEKQKKIQKVIQEVGLKITDLSKYPHEFSGGQRQRIAIARALILEPSLLILDEPTSALDVTIQAQILSLLQQIQQQRKLTYIFISHDMHAIRIMSDEIAVMKDGNIIEYGKRDEIFQTPKQEYTKNLILASIS